MRYLVIFAIIALVINSVAISDIMEVVEIINTPVTQFSSVAFHQNFLWVTSPNTKMYRLNPENGSVILTANYMFSGLIFVGNYLYGIGGQPSPIVDLNKIYKMRPEDGAILSSLQLKSNIDSPNGLAWDGRYFWACSGSAKMIYKIDPSDGSIIKEFTSPNICNGLAHDGMNLWVATYNPDKIHKVDPNSGTIISSFDAPEADKQTGDTRNPAGLDFDDDYYLWVAIDESGNLYKLDVGSRPYPNTITSKDGASMVLIPSGEFQMGGNDGEADEKPIHTVYLNSFYMDIYPVTNAQYKKFMDATGHRSPKYWSDPKYNAPNYPVVGISWYDAVAYCEWAGKRLPTEAEWEYAARGGLTGKKYPWGDIVTHDNANYSGTGGRDIWDVTSPVGSFSSNGYGLYDMVGNISVYCSDWYDPNYYLASPRNNPAGPNIGNYKVMRGCNWACPDSEIRVSNRETVTPTKIELNNGGFRCAMNAPPAPLPRIMSININDLAPGAKGNMQIGINDASGITSADIAIKYNSNIMTIDDVKLTEITSKMILVVNKDTPGVLIISMAGTDSILSGSGSIVDIGLTIRPNAIIGSQTMLEFGDVAIYDESLEPIPVILQNAILAIIPPGIKGDVNNDGKVKSNDAVLALRISAVLITPTDYQKWAADMNEDGAVRSNDAVLILRKSAGLGAPMMENISGDCIVKLGEVYGESGSFISVPITIDNANVLSGGDICITYDNSVLNAVDVISDSGVFLAENIGKGGIIHISFAGMNEIDNGKLVEIKFSVITDNLSPLTIETADLYRNDASPINTKIINGMFKSLKMAPDSNLLLQNYPNPFNPETWIPYQLKDSGDVIIRIHNANGALVRELKLGHKPAGIYMSQDRAVYWDGKNEAGESVASGIYFYTIQTGNYNATKKMILKK